MNIKKLNNIFIVLFIMVIVIFAFLLSCTKNEPTYIEQFNLKRFKMKQFDLYNPILNTFKIDPIKRSESPNYYYFDSYFDDNNIIRYSFYRSESYGYLQEFIYNNEGRLLKVKIYPILVDSIHSSAGIYTNQYYYINGDLKAFKDELNGRLVLIDHNLLYIYDGVLSSGNVRFSIKKVKTNDYFNTLLISVVSVRPKN